MFPPKLQEWGMLCVQEHIYRKWENYWKNHASLKGRMCRCIGLLVEDHALKLLLVETTLHSRSIVVWCLMVWHQNCCYRLLSYLLASQCIFDPSFLYNTWTKCPLLQNRSSHNKSDFIADKCGFHAGYYFILILFKIDVSWADLFGLNASRRWHVLFSLLAFVQLAVNHFMATRMLI
jgi:hypothetical protein